MALATRRGAGDARGPTRPRLGSRLRSGLPPRTIAGLATVGAWVIVGFGIPGCGSRPESFRPNVLLISIDTLRHDFLGAYGDPKSPTPALDRLAATGTIFVNALSTSSWTLPSHVSLFTGQYPSSHGLTGDGRSLAPGKTTLAEVLSERGYRTGGFVSGPYLHRGYGFDRGFGVYEHCVSWGEKLTDQGLVENVIGANLRSHSGITSPDVHERVAAWLEHVQAPGPWFLFVHYWDPHYDFTPPGPLDRYLDPGYSGRITGHGFLQDDRIAADMPANERGRLLDLYRGEIRFTDRWIERLLELVEARGDLDNTLVVVVGDHGEEFFEHGEKGHRNNLYEETLRIPMIVHLPDRAVSRLPAFRAPGSHASASPASPAASRSSGSRGLIVEPVSLVDLLPTVAGILDLPGDRTGEAMGVDWRAWGEREAVFGELHDELVSVRTAEWKLVLDRKTGGEELFGLASDPAETENLAPERPDVVQRLRELLGEAALDRFAPGAVPEATLDEETEEALRSLGYTE